jgi:hypothetical protein
MQLRCLKKPSQSLLAQCNRAKEPSNASCYAVHDAAVFAVTHPEHRSLVQIPDLAKLIQTPNVQVGREQRAKHRLATREKVCFDFPLCAVEAEVFHVQVIVIIVFVLVIRSAVDLCALDQYITAL